jgi:hypothetical protein
MPSDLSCTTNVITFAFEKSAKISQEFGGSSKLFKAIIMTRKVHHFLKLKTKIRLNLDSRFNILSTHVK